MFNKSNIFGRDINTQRSTPTPPASQPVSGAGKLAGAAESTVGRPTIVSGRAAPESYKPAIRTETTEANPGATTSQALTQGATASADESMDARLIVGPQVKLCGAEILNCDTLIVEGRVEATMDSRVLRITEHGSFYGKVSIDVAEIYGHFEGELTARSQLVIHSTGSVRGRICYGTLVAEEGCELSGDINILNEKTMSSARDAENGGARPSGRSARNSSSTLPPSGNTAAADKDKLGKSASSLH